MGFAEIGMLYHGYRIAYRSICIARYQRTVGICSKGSLALLLGLGGEDSRLVLFSDRPPVVATTVLTTPHIFPIAIARVTILPLNVFPLSMPTGAEPVHLLSSALACPDLRTARAMMSCRMIGISNVHPPIRPRPLQHLTVTIGSVRSPVTVAHDVPPHLGHLVSGLALA